MKPLSIFLVACLAVVLAACSVIAGDQTVGSGNVITEKRVVADFTSLELTCSANVDIVQGEPLAVSIEGEDNIIPLIETKISDRKLSIGVKAFSSYSHTKPLTVHIVAPVLISIQVTGSGDVKAEKWMGDNLALTTTGSGNIIINKLDTPSLTAMVSGSGDIRLLGGVGAIQTITTSGSGNYEAAAMQSREVVATTSGSGGITVWVVKMLTATISGSGNIQYYGSPWVNQVDTGSGSVEKLGDKP
jgi:hypothetical protein